MPSSSCEDRRRLADLGLDDFFFTAALFGREDRSNVNGKRRGGEEFPDHDRGRETNSGGGQLVITNTHEASALFVVPYNAGTGR